MNTKSIKSKDRRTYHCIRPRYTPGAPAIVDYEFAKQFTIEERNEYRKNLRGEYGEKNRQRAERLGLEGIAQTRIKHVDKKDNITYSITDLITNKERETVEDLPINEFKPIYILAIEIEKDWDNPGLICSQLIKLLRRVSFIGDTTLTDKNCSSTISVTATTEELIIKFLASSSEWKTSKANSVKKEMSYILCKQTSKINDENMKAMAKVIYKRFE